MSEQQATASPQDVKVQLAIELGRAAALDKFASEQRDQLTQQVLQAYSAPIHKYMLKVLKDRS